jgi:hypothetical protein
MDFDAQKKKRAEALDDKRKRIEEMRKLRESRNNDNSNSSNSSSSSSSGGIDTRADIDNLVNSLLVTTKNDDKNNDISSSSLPLPPPPSSSLSSSLIDRPKKVLSIVTSLTSITILPKPPILYDKDCQTDDVIPLSSLSLNDDNDNNNNDDRHSPQKLAHRRVVRHNSNNNNNSSPNPKDDNINDTTIINTSNNDIEKSLEFINRKILTEEEHQSILSSSSFSTFLNQSSKILERAINTNDNITRD